MREESRTRKKINGRMDSELIERWKEAADHEGITYAEWLERAVIDALRKYK